MNSDQISFTHPIFLTYILILFPPSKPKTVKSYVPRGLLNQDMWDGEDRKEASGDDKLKKLPENMACKDHLKDLDKDRDKGKGKGYRCV